MRGLRRGECGDSWSHSVKILEGTGLLLQSHSYCEARGMYLVLLLHSCVVDTLQVVKTWQKLGNLPSQQLCFYLTAYRGWSVRKGLCIIYNLLQTETSLNNAETSTIYGYRNISIQTAVLQQQQLPCRVCVVPVHVFLTRFIVPGINSSYRAGVKSIRKQPVTHIIATLLMHQ